MTRDVFLSAKRVDLVLLEKSDAPIVQNWVNDHRITSFLGRGARPMYRHQEEEWIEGLVDRTEQLVLGIWHQDDQKLIGSIGLHEIDQINRTAELGIMIGETDYWSAGLGGEAIATICGHGFAWFGLRHIILRVLGNNPRGQRCYKRLGFIQTGLFPQHILKNGQWHDEIYMLLTKDTFVDE